MIKPGVYPVKAVDEYRKFIDEIVRDREDIAAVTHISEQEKLENSIASDIYIDIRVKMDKLEHLMKQIMTSSDEGRIFNFLCAQLQLIAVNELIDKCIVSCEPLIEIIHSCKKMEEQELKELEIQDENN